MKLREKEEVGHILGALVNFASSSFSSGWPVLPLPFTLSLPGSLSLSGSSPSWCLLASSYISHPLSTTLQETLAEQQQGMAWATQQGMVEGGDAAGYGGRWRCIENFDFYCVVFGISPLSQCPTHSRVTIRQNITQHREPGRITSTTRGETTQI